MKESIQAFIEAKKVAIAGASNNKDNFGRSLVEELTKMGYEVTAVNPKCTEIDGVPCVPGVKDLPEGYPNLILAVPPALSEKIVAQSVDTQIQRVWMIQGVGRGAYSEQAHLTCKEHNMEVVYGFCPMMFFGKGAHKFHLWIKKIFGRLPREYRASLS